MTVFKNSNKLTFTIQTSQQDDNSYSRISMKIELEVIHRFNVHERRKW